MSCTIVNNRVMSVAANLLSRMLNNGFNSFGFDVPGDFPLAFKSCYINHSYSAKKIYERLYELNFKAYEERYGSCDRKTLDIFVKHQNQMPNVDIWEPRDKDDRIKAWHCKALKCLQDVHYQLCEGRVCEFDEVQFIEQMIFNLCVFIATHTEEYIKAEPV